MNTPYLSKWITGLDYTMNVYLDFVNYRIRIDDYRGNHRAIILKVKELAIEHSFTKQIIKARGEDWRVFLEAGYSLEGIIDNYFNGSDAFFMVMYENDDRRTSRSWLEEDVMLEKIKALPLTVQIEDVQKQYELRLATKDDCQKLAHLYNTVFQSYPTPMNDETYIQKVMDEGTIFIVVEWKGEIVSSASAEVNHNYHNAEITDCATLPAHRKFGFMQIVITRLEQQLISENIYCAYSLARAQSFGMNACLKKLGYRYTGRLLNNCMMNGNFENMNIWVKQLV